MTDENYINILGKRVDYHDTRHSINDLKFYTKNPRVLSNLIQAGKLDGTDHEKQEAVEQGMLSESSVKKLLKTIPQQGGISEPLVINSSNREVLEGNSRLAALRTLYRRHEEEKYLTVPCREVSLEDDQIDAFLYQQHVEGKTEWSPYDKAYSTYYRIRENNISIATYAKRISTSENEIKKQIAIIDLMHKEGAQADKDKFSYYEQLIRSRKLKSCIDADSGLKSYLLKEIKSEKPKFTALEIRDDVPKIAENPKLLEKFVSGGISFASAREQAQISGAKQNIKRAMEYLRNIDRVSVERLSIFERKGIGEDAERCLLEIDRIKKIIERVSQ